MFNLAFLTIVLVIIIFVYYGIKNSGKPSPKDIHMTKDEFVRCLDFMMMHNVIDYQQYNDMLVKGVQFTKD